MIVHGNDRHPDRLPVLTPEEMRKTEEKAFALGVPPLLLMEHAAEAVVDALCEALGNAPARKRVLFLCGTGNNGGDGLAAARLFLQRGGQAEVWLRGQPRTDSAKAQLAWLQALPGAIIRDISALKAEEQPFAPGGSPNLPFDGYVDALLGTGLRGAPDDLTAQMIHVPAHDFSGGHHPVVAVDIPSGMDGQTGACPGAFVWADVTVTFHAPKLGLYLTPQREAVGKIVTADIGLWDMAFDSDALELDASPLRCETLLPSALSLLPQRELNAHKGSAGRIAIYGGSLGMAGAAAMCAKAAVTAGAGLTTILCPREVIPILQTLVPSAMCRDVQTAAAQPRAWDVLALGPGLGQGEGVWENILRLFDPDIPSVWDADALNLLAQHPMRLGGNAVMTPHPGEAARLLGWPMAQVLSDRLTAAKALSEKFECAVALKSDVTVLYDSRVDCSLCLLNTVGTPALAKGGSGDVLTGILATLLHPCAFEAPALACLWHGLAAMAGEKKFGRRELTSDQLIACLFDAEKQAEQESKPVC